MPIIQPLPGETREMILFTAVLSKRVRQTLPQFLASRRAPGDGWRPWEAIVYELTEATGVLVTDGTIRRWAKRYGIPEDTEQDGPAEAFHAALDAAGIKI